MTAKHSNLLVMWTCFWTKPITILLHFETQVCLCLDCVPGWEKGQGGVHSGTKGHAP